MIKFYNGEIDRRMTYDVIVSGGIVTAYQVKDDYTLDSVFIDDFEYERSIRTGDYVIDVTAEVAEKVMNVKRAERVGQDGFMGLIGNIVKVVRGKKYPLGYTTKICGYAEFSPIGCYGHQKTFYIIGTNGERIDRRNIEIIG